jgi:uncharacterized YccA/Bax inhibitor family protein
LKAGILAAWLAGEALVIWRIVHRDHALPAPGVLLGISGLFLAGALIAEWMPKSESLVMVTLVGLDVAALMNALPAGLAGQIGQAEQASATALGQGAGTAAESGAAAGEGSGGKLKG